MPPSSWPNLAMPRAGEGEADSVGEKKGADPNDLSTNGDKFEKASSDTTNCRSSASSPDHSLRLREPSRPSVRSTRSSRRSEPSRSRRSESEALPEDWYLEVKAVLEAPQLGHLWHVICACGGIGTTTDGTDPLNIPDAATAVIIMTDLLSVPSSQNAVRQLSKEGLDAPIIVVILVEESEQTPKEMKAMLKAHRAHFTAGANDVVMQAGLLPGPWMVVTTSLIRIDDQMLAAEKLGDQFEARIQKFETRGIEPSCGMFWQSVQKVFRELPPLQRDVTSNPQPGAKVGDFILSYSLGRGSCGDVYAGTNQQSGEVEAIKAISKEQLNQLKFVEDLRKEIRVLRAFKNEHIMACYGIIHGPKHLFIRLEKVGTCSLNRALGVAGGSFHMGAIRHLQGQISDGLAYCSSKAVAHRDIKPENIGISDCGSHVKLLDFGSAAPSHTACADMAGTMPFMAPEVLMAEDTRPYDPSRIDVWSSGVVLLEMLCGWGTLNKMCEWKGRLTPKKARAKDLEKYFSDPDALRSYVEKEVPSIEEQLFVLLSGMLQVDGKLRWTALQCPESRWLQKEVPAFDPMQPET